MDSFERNMHASIQSVPAAFAHPIGCAVLEPKTRLDIRVVGDFRSNGDLIGLIEQKPAKFEHQPIPVTLCPPAIQRPETPLADCPPYSA
ncbi:MAG: hypothetical protein ACSHXI_08405 [Hoeflea sp.]|uniref:hypothetical protein n=1 Tax=Hoeflea sp. TaxID=1940281 RepID=UPI003EFAB6EC